MSGRKLMNRGRKHQCTQAGWISLDKEAAGDIKEMVNSC